MKKTIVMLAMLGASLGLSAQAYQKPDKINKDKTGISETSYEKTPVPDKTAVIIPEKVAVVVPEKVKEGFKRDYYTYDIKPIWSKEGENYKVSFEKANNLRKAKSVLNGYMLTSNTLVYKCLEC